MDFLKRNWSTLLLIGAIAIYFGLSMGTDRCPMCVVTNLIFNPGEDEPAATNQALVVGEQESPEWEVGSIDGKALSSESCKGKVAVLVYWATWCAPCREEIPTLIALRNEYSDQEVDIIGISLDEASKSIENFITVNKINYTIARNNKSLDEAFGPIRYIPTTVVLDKEGKVQQRYTGLVAPNVLRGQVESLLNKKA